MSNSAPVDHLPNLLRRLDENHLRDITRHYMRLANSDLEVDSQFGFQRATICLQECQRRMIAMHDLARVKQYMKALRTRGAA